MASKFAQTTITVLAIVSENVENKIFIDVTKIEIQAKPPMKSQGNTAVRL